MTNAINWFEIPSTNLDRAVAFYQAILEVELRYELFMDTPNAMFPASAEGVGGAIIQSDAKPSADGAIVYLNANGRLHEVLGRVEQAGGAVLLPATSIGAPGWIAMIRDSEGNRIGLHSES